MEVRLSSVFRRPTTLYPDRIAMIDGDRQFTYREFGERVAQLANGLKAAGIKPGDAVATLCMNHHRYLEMYFACHIMGAIVIPMNIRLKEPEIVYILNDSKAKGIFIDEPFMPMLAKIREGAKGLKKVWYSDSGELPEGMDGFNDLVNGQSTEFEPVEMEENVPAGYFYTGGTTGEPKGVMLTGRNLVSNAFHLQSIMHYTPHDRYLHIAPMFHLADAASIYAVTMMGGTHVFGRAFEP
jgi:long-chain acyl-CoA synthetase